MYIQLAWRNIWRNPRRTAIILTAIFIGVSAMVILAALMRGMVGGMLDNAINNFVGHIKIQQPDYRADPDITHRIIGPEKITEVLDTVLPKKSRVVQRVRVDGVVSNARETAGVEIIGTDLKKETGVSFIGKATIDGKLVAETDQHGILIGAALADQLNTRVGKKLVVTTQQADGETGSSAFRIRGIFHADMASTEKAYVFISFAASQKLTGDLNAVTEIAISLPPDKIDQLDIITHTCQNALTPFSVNVYQWQNLLPAISAYLDLFDMFLLIWFVVIFIAMGFGIVNTVLMAVYERMREFGLLKAIGMKPSRIIRMVLGESLFLLLIGCFAGTVCGMALILYFSQNGIDLAAFSQGTDMWGVSRIIMPVVKVSDIVFANAVVIFLGLLVSVYPAIKAARFTPVETMRQV